MSVPLTTSPCLSNGLNVFLGFHPQRGNTGVSGVKWTLVTHCRAHRANVGQVSIMSQGGGTDKREGRRQGGRRRGCVSARESLWASDEAGEWLQGGGGGDGTGQPGVQLQPWAQRVSRGAAERQQRRGGVLQFDGTDLELLLAPPLCTPVLEPHLKKITKINMNKEVSLFF